MYSLSPEVIFVAAAAQRRSSCYQRPSHHQYAKYFLSHNLKIFNF
jgi:hypothetical protein